MATHSSVLAWRIPGTGEPGGLLSMGSHRVGHNWSDSAARQFTLWNETRLFSFTSYFSPHFCPVASTLCCINDPAWCGFGVCFVIFCFFGSVQQRNSLFICGYVRLPRWHSGKESICQCRRHKRHRFDLWVGKIPRSRKWQPILVFLPGKSHGQRSLAAYSPQGCKESDTTEHRQTHVNMSSLLNDTTGYIVNESYLMRV